MPKKLLAFNEKTALEIFKILDFAWRNKQGVFKDAVLPEDLWVPKEWDSFSDAEKANFLFFAALPMRGGLVSEDPFKWVCALRNKFPDLFNPRIVAVDFPPERIEESFRIITSEILSNGSIGKSGGGSFGYQTAEHARHWHKNATALNSYWGADIRNVFWGVTEFEEAFRRIDHKRTETGFKGMRRKIFSLLVLWLQEKGLIPQFPAPIPVDFHAMRILWQTEAVNMQSRMVKFVPKKPEHPKDLFGQEAVRIYEEVPDQIAVWSQSFLLKNGLSHMVICPALWTLSRTLCAEHLQTSSLKNGQKFFTAEKLETNPDLWKKNYKNPCEFCLIKSFCKWCISSNPYYRYGWLIRIKRIRYPQQRLHGINWPELGPTYQVRKSKNRGAKSS